MAPTGYTDRDGHLEAGLLKSTEGEKQTRYQDFTPLVLKKKKNNKMIYFRRVLLIIAVSFVLGLGVATARPSFVNCRTHQDPSKMAVAAKAHGSNAELVEALRKTSPDLLHRLLHAYLPERYQHGVFASDQDAIDAINENDPSVASAIVQIAKRQDSPSNNNSTVPASSSTSAGPPSSSSPGSTTNSPAQSSTDSSSSTAAGSSDTGSSSTTAAQTTPSSKLCSSSVLFLDIWDTFHHHN